MCGTRNVFQDGAQRAARRRVRAGLTSFQPVGARVRNGKAITMNFGRARRGRPCLYLRDSTEGIFFMDL
jgi:hypothetical protein